MLFGIIPIRELPTGGAGGSHDEVTNFIGVKLLWVEFLLVNDDHWRGSTVGQSDGHKDDRSARVDSVRISDKEGWQGVSGVREGDDEESGWSSTSWGGEWVQGLNTDGESNNLSIVDRQ